MGSDLVDILLSLDRRNVAVYLKEWSEQQHPRDDHGRFSETPGGDLSSALGAYTEDGWDSLSDDQRATIRAAVDSAGPNETELLRGSWSTDASIVVGSHISLDVKSATDDPAVARRSEGVSIMHIPPGAADHALSVNDAMESNDFGEEHEWLVSGEFTVESVEKAADGTTDIQLVGAPKGDGDSVPPLPGETPIPEGAVRLFHVTPLGNADSIRENGLQVSSARGNTYGEPNMVWGSAGIRSSQAQMVIDHGIMDSQSAVVEFWAKPEELDIGHFSTPEEMEARQSDVTLYGSVPPEQIVAIHEPWHAAYRYLLDFKDEVRAGEYDFAALDNENYARAIDAIKAGKSEKFDEHLHPRDHQGRFAEDPGRGIFGELGSGTPVASAEYLADARRRRDEGIAYIARENGADPVTLKKEADEHVREIIEPTTPSIRVHSEDLEQILTDGELVNRFQNAEVDSRTREDASGWRAAWEEQAFGLPLDTPSKDRPVYGFLAEDPAAVEIKAGTPQGIGLYGDVVLVMKDEVKDRTTFTLGDSGALNATSYDPDLGQEPEVMPHTVPQPVKEPSSDAWDWAGDHTFDLLDESGYLPMHPETVTETPLDLPSADWMLEHGGYYEAQIHGGVKTSDIAEVVFTVDHTALSWSHDDELKRRLDAMGIPWRDDFRTVMEPVKDPRPGGRIADYVFRPEHETYKADFTPSLHPRYPAGTPGGLGGQFISTDTVAVPVEDPATHMRDRAEAMDLHVGDPVHFISRNDGRYYHGTVTRIDEQGVHLDVPKQYSDHTSGNEDSIKEPEHIRPEYLPIEIPPEAPVYEMANGNVIVGPWDPQFPDLAKYATLIIEHDPAPPKVRSLTAVEARVAIREDKATAPPFVEGERVVATTGDVGILMRYGGEGGRGEGTAAIRLDDGRVLADVTEGLQHAGTWETPPGWIAAGVRADGSAREVYQRTETEHAVYASSTDDGSGRGYAIEFPSGWRDGVDGILGLRDAVEYSVGQNHAMEEDSGLKNRWNGTIKFDTMSQGVAAYKDWGCSIAIGDGVLRDLRGSDRYPPGPKDIEDGQGVLSHELAHGLSTDLSTDGYKGHTIPLEEGVAEAYREAFMTVQQRGRNALSPLEIGTKGWPPGYMSYNAYVTGVNQALVLRDHGVKNPPEDTGKKETWGDRLDWARELLQTPLAQREEKIFEATAPSGQHVEFIGTGIGSEMGYRVAENERKSRSPQTADDVRAIIMSSLGSVEDAERALGVVREWIAEHPEDATTVGMDAECLHMLITAQESPGQKDFTPRLHPRDAHGQFVEVPVIDRLAAEIVSESTTPENYRETWRPTMSPAEGHAWAEAAGTQYPTTVVHVTAKRNVDGIEGTGFDAASQSVHESGRYFALDPPAAGFYDYKGDELLSAVVVLQHPLVQDWRDPEGLSESARLGHYRADALEQAGYDLGDPKELVNAISPNEPVDPGGSEYVWSGMVDDYDNMEDVRSRYRDAQILEDPEDRQSVYDDIVGYIVDESHLVTEALKAKGFDGVIIHPLYGPEEDPTTGGEQLIVFDREQAVVIGEEHIPHFDFTKPFEETSPGRFERVQDPDTREGENEAIARAFAKEYTEELHPRDSHGRFTLVPGRNTEGSAQSAALFAEFRRMIDKSPAASPTESAASKLKIENVEEIGSALANRPYDPDLLAQLEEVGQRVIDAFPDEDARNNDLVPAMSLDDDGLTTGMPNGYQEERLHLTEGLTLAEVGGREVASRMQDSWMQSASDNSALSWGMQLAVAERTGVNPTETQSFLSLTQGGYTDSPGLVGVSGAGGMDTLADMSQAIADSPAIKAYVDEVYTDTQEYLAKRGIAELSLTRGVSFEIWRNMGDGTYAKDNSEDPLYEAGQAGGDQRVVLNPVSSFTMDTGTANQFGQSSSRSNGYLLTATVPAERVFSIAPTGPGCLWESEVLVVGGPSMVDIEPTYHEEPPAVIVPPTEAEVADLQNTIDKLVAAGKDFNPSLHPRDDHGRFAEVPGLPAIKPGRDIVDWRDNNRLADMFYELDPPGQEGAENHLKRTNVDLIGADLATKAENDPELADQLQAIAKVVLDVNKANAFRAGQWREPMRLGDDGLTVGYPTMYQQGHLHLREGMTAEEVGARQAAASLQDTWATSSTNSHADSWGLQLAVAERMGVDTAEARRVIKANDYGGHDDAAVVYGIRNVETDLLSQSEAIAKSPVVRAYVDEVYSATQIGLQARGVKEATLYRGIAFPRSPSTDPFWSVQYNQPTNRQITMNPMSSFSLQEGTAETFARIRQGQLASGGGGATGYIMTATIPAERVFSMPSTGPGCLGEQEFLVVGGDIEVEAKQI